ncbi:hypothetical protein EOA75_01320 [Mesorhizobium sp. M1A.F.Ca.IN.022.07.1.1]|uniref:hypothetical protein n=1 Tax=unclassified Mesorhizobium TaxID=325217 RepID=UPI000FCA5ADD|nr:MULTISPECIES: hypothetical protein [unclassified Mesorhizobium]MDG4853828.1 hypothetical protein [Mesorhizobium sp. WSM4982]MDG4887668.1 hypothetical protein [Mesorhizobium sp. WSM4887]MDG4915673.1 hypothetical protein [Mesorhizobium sp. WSM4983]RUV98203.1 hypothetical protein EOA75_01320 [Mesorhizobium sp. M1A.F.Ca.IN.022.07.1.1]RWH19356.1 MAG: hypothetical protein EOQ76_26860 [Mesorhizobium sp.]
MFRCIVSALVLGLATAPCRAENANAFIYSYGLKTCGAFVAAEGDNHPGKAILRMADGRKFFDESANFMNWVLGYLSAVNMMRAPGKPSIELDNAAVDLWLRNWCDAHPTNSIFDGTLALVAEENKAQ